jgi:hypothetical protein
MKRPSLNQLCFLVMIALMTVSCKKDPAPYTGVLQLVKIQVGSVQLSYPGPTQNVPYNADLLITFSAPADSLSALENISISSTNGTAPYSLTFSNGFKTLNLHPIGQLKDKTQYTLKISSKMQGRQGESFLGTEYAFVTTQGNLTLNTATINNQNFLTGNRPQNIPLTGSLIQLTFSDPLDTTQLSKYFQVTGGIKVRATASADQKSVQVQFLDKLSGYTSYTFSVSSMLSATGGYSFAGFSNIFFSALDSTLKFQPITDEELLTLVQKQTFRYFYDFGHPVSGLARERNTSGDIVTSGGSGFGIMALVVGMERGFISRSDGLTRLSKIVGFLETSDRFHGAWSHWLNGSSGKVVPFGTKDNGGDLVETSYLMQGLLTIRQYLNTSVPSEKDLADRITQLFETVEWDWYTRGGQNVLYWHWSPNYGWDMNFKIQGYNETLITYVMAASSPTHTIPATAYQQGFARSGGILNGKSFYGYTLPLGFDYGGPLFFAHYSFLGLDPRNLSDAYANYWTQNMNHSLINWAYCKANPRKYPNYSTACWGLTASDNSAGYGVCEPSNDIGVIAPTAAISSLPYTPEQSMAAIRFFYYILGDHLWGPYGFYDAFDVHKGWWGDSTLAIDQGPQIVMIENYRTGLLWNLFMSAPEVQSGLTKLGFSYTKKKSR